MGKKIDKRLHANKRSARTGRKQVPQFVGKVQMTRDGFIFVIIEGQDDDVYVKAAKTRQALNGDLVRVAVTHQGGQGKKHEPRSVQRYI